MNLKERMVIGLFLSIGAGGLLVFFVNGRRERARLESLEHLVGARRNLTEKLLDIILNPGETSSAREYAGRQLRDRKLSEDAVIILRERENEIEAKETQLSPPERDAYAQVYLLLGDLHRELGNARQADDAWRRGLERFPGHPELTGRQQQ